MHSPDDIDAFHVLMTTLAAYTKDKPDFSTILEGYFDDLRHLPLEQVAAVFALARRRHTFFPSIPELLQIAGEAFASPALLPPRNQALEAWNAVRRTTGSRAYNEEALNDPITHHCVQAMGGRAGFGTWNYDQDETRMRQYFCDLYQTYLLRQAQYVSHEEAERLLKDFGYDHTFGGHWLGAGDDDDELMARD